MNWNSISHIGAAARRMGLAVLVPAILIMAVASACTVSYSFTGTSINYDIIKSIQIDKIANRAPYGWAPMEAMFNNTLQDAYVNQTRLKLVKRGGDLHLAGEITAYEQTIPSYRA